MNKMEGRVAVITGGASGLGAEDARILAKEGATVVITDIQDDLGRRVAAGLPNCHYLHHDVRDADQWDFVIHETKSRFGRIDTLVNNAGIIKFGNIENQSTDDFWLQINVILGGTYLGCRAAIPHMARGGTASIINIASVAGLRGISAVAGYSAAKSGVIGLSRSVAVHCREQAYRIRVNTIAPGGIATPMTTKALDELPSEDAGLKQIHTQGMGAPSDIANMVLYLACDDGRHINGATITIDNGETMA